MSPVVFLPMFVFLGLGYGISALPVEYQSTVGAIAMVLIPLLWIGSVISAKEIMHKQIEREK